MLLYENAETIISEGIHGGFVGILEATATETRNGSQLIPRRSLEKNIRVTIGHRIMLTTVPISLFQRRRGSRLSALLRSKLRLSSAPDGQPEGNSKVREIRLGECNMGSEGQTQGAIGILRKYLWRQIKDRCTVPRGTNDRPAAASLADCFACQQSRRNRQHVFPFSLFARATHTPEIVTSLRNAYRKVLFLFRTDVPRPRSPVRQKRLQGESALRCFQCFQCF